MIRSTQAPDSSTARSRHGKVRKVLSCRPSDRPVVGECVADDPGSWPCSALAPPTPFGRRGRSSAPPPTGQPDSTPPDDTPLPDVRHTPPGAAAADPAKRPASMPQRADRTTPALAAPGAVDQAGCRCSTIGRRPRDLSVPARGRRPRPAGAARSRRPIPRIGAPRCATPSPSRFASRNSSAWPRATSIARATCAAPSSSPRRPIPRSGPAAP